MIMATCVFAQTKSSPYINTKLGFSLMLPQDWNQEGEVKQEGETISVTLKNNLNNFMLIKVNKGPAVKTIEDVEAYNLRTDPSTKNERISLNGMKGVKAVIHVNIDGVETKDLAYFLLEGKTQYVITGMSGAAGIDADSAIRILENIIETFKLK